MTEITKALQSPVKKPSTLLMSSADENFPQGGSAYLIKKYVTV